MFEFNKHHITHQTCYFDGGHLMYRIQSVPERSSIVEQNGMGRVLLHYVHFSLKTFSGGDRELSKVIEFIKLVTMVVSFLFGVGTLMIYTMLKFHIGFRSFLPIIIAWINEKLFNIWYDPVTGEIYEINIFLILLASAVLLWLSTR